MGKRHASRSPERERERSLAHRQLTLPEVRVKNALHFQVLAYRQDDVWLAHCLECNAVAQGDTLDDAFDGIVNAITILVDDALLAGDLHPVFEPADVERWDEYAVARAHLSAAQREPRHLASSPEICAVAIPA